MLAELASVEEGARLLVLPRVQHVVAATKTKQEQLEHESNHKIPLSERQSSV